jgi:hypothetical protein
MYTPPILQSALPRHCGIIGTGKLVAVASRRVDGFLFAVGYSFLLGINGHIFLIDG